MKKLIKILFYCTASFMMHHAYGQSTLTFSFSGVDDSSYVQLDSIKVKNLTQACDTVLHYPDTVLVIYNVGIRDKMDPAAGFQLHQNVPNPFSDQTSISLYLPVGGQLSFEVTNVIGQRLLTADKTLDQGRHTFRFTSGKEGLLLFTVNYEGCLKTIRILNMNPHVAASCALEYTGSVGCDLLLKDLNTDPDFLFSPGDNLMLIGFASGLESGFVDSPEESLDYVFQFATNISCPGLDSLLYEGQWYQTIQVFGQCWMKENLNAGAMITSPQLQHDNGILEKYCLVDDPEECERYGGIYMWEELMQYSHEEGAQGICPPGWHVPTDADWQVLEGAVDSYYGIGSPVWIPSGERGYDAGTNLKSTSGWYGGGNGTDLYGFTAISGGYYYYNGGWAGGPLLATFYTSSSLPVGSTVRPYHRNLSWVWSQSSKNPDLKEHARSVRCLKDQP